MVPLSAAHTPMHTHRPSDLLMVHAMLTLAVKPIPKASASEFSQKTVGLYASNTVLKLSEIHKAVSKHINVLTLSA